MFKFLQGVYKVLGNALLSPYLYLRWKRDLRINTPNERAKEYSFVLEELSKRPIRTVLDVGSGESSFPHVLASCGYRVKAVDKINGYWASFFNRHYHIEKRDIANISSVSRSRRYDAITCISVLEHIPDFNEAFQNMIALLRPGGILILTFPYNELISVNNAYDLQGSSYGANFRFICRMFNRDDLDKLMQGSCLPIEILSQKYYECFTGTFWSQGERLNPIKEHKVSGIHHLTAVVFERKAIR